MIEVKNLFCGYEKNDIIKDISFSCKKGECLSIIGPNGCGKTTLLRALSGMIDYRGSIKITGDELNTIKKRKAISKKLALMTQISEGYFSYSVYDSVAMGRYVHSDKNIFSSDDTEKEIVMECLKKVGLCDLKDKNITELSGGQLQRVFLARIFAQQPQIILLDEPTNHLDIRYQLELLEYLKQWVKEGERCVIGVFHDINLSVQLGNRIILINDGKIVFNGNSKTIVDGDIINSVYGANIKEYMKKSYSVWNK